MTTDGVVEGGLDEPTELEPDQGSLDLASPDDRYTAADWESAAAAVLRRLKRMTDDDADSLAWDTLARTTLDGIALTPLGTPDLLADLQTSGRPTRAGEWDVRTRLAGSDSQALNQTALVELDGGVTSLWLAADAETDLAAVLDGVLLDLAPVVLDAPEGAQVSTARAFLDVLGETAAADGTNLGGRVSASSTTEELVEVARLARDAGVLGAVVDATVVHDRGASDVQELGYSMAVGATALRALTDAGFGVDEAAQLIEFRYAVTAEQFPMIAKLRAARRLWARVLELSGVSTGSSDDRPQRQHAVTSRPMMSKYDPWTNMLRTTVAAFSAGAGGADCVTVLPFDSPLGRPDGLGRRIARNTSPLLMWESHVAKVADPAGGAYAVEKLTDDLAVAAWTELGRIEEDGVDALDERIVATAAQRETEIARRMRPITGLTEFPNLAESLPEREPWTDDVRRYGASFEAMRDEPVAQPVFLATLGTVAQHTARATFATNLLAAGGIAVAPAGSTDGVETLVAAYAGQPVVCLAGSDAAYSDWGREAIAALRRAGAAHVIVAGVSTSSTTEMFDDADDSCAVGIDALDFVTRTRRKLA